MPLAVMVLQGNTVIPAGFTKLVSDGVAVALQLHRHSESPDSQNPPYAMPGQHTP